MKRRGSQLKLFNDKKSPHHFGGRLLQSHPKTKRPLSTKHSIHLVLKSKHALGPRSLLGPKNRRRVDEIVRGWARKKGLRLYHFVNVGNHLHLVLRIGSSNAQSGRRSYRAFVCTISGLIARHVLGAERGQAKGVQFWEARPFTRLVSWGRDYARLCRYIEKNMVQREARVNFIAWGFSVTDPDRIERLEAS